LHAFQDVDTPAQYDLGHIDQIEIQLRESDLRVEMDHPWLRTPPNAGNPDLDGKSALSSCLGVHPDPGINNVEHPNAFYNIGCGGSI
jgi:hypothetical protein